MAKVLSSPGTCTSTRYIVGRKITSCKNKIAWYIPCTPRCLPGSRAHYWGGYSVLCIIKSHMTACKESVLQQQNWTVSSHLQHLRPPWSAAASLPPAPAILFACWAQTTRYSQCTSLVFPPANVHWGSKHLVQAESEIAAIYISRWQPPSLAKWISASSQDYQCLNSVMIASRGIPAMSLDVLYNKVCLSEVPWAPQQGTPQNGCQSLSAPHKYFSFLTPSVSFPGSFCMGPSPEEAPSVSTAGKQYWNPKEPQATPRFVGEGFHLTITYLIWGNRSCHSA